MFTNRRLIALSAGIAMSVTLASAQAQSPEHKLPVKIGSCAATLVAKSPWTRNGDGTFSNRSSSAFLVPKGTSLRLPMVTRGPMRVNPLRLSFPLDARVLPIPKSGPFGELVAAVNSPGPVSAGIDTGANIRRRVPGLFVHPRRSYLYFSTTNPFVLNMDKRNRSAQARNQAKRSTGASARSAKPRRKGGKLVAMGFALDPCDPAVFFGGVTVNASGVTGTLDGIGFSVDGKVQHRTRMPVWTGGTRANGQPVLKPFQIDGHFYVSGTLGVGLGKFLSLSGSASATVNLAPLRNGALGITEAMQLLKGRAPPRLPDLQLVLEGSQQVTLPGLKIPFARVAIGLDAKNPRSVRLALAGEQRRGTSLSALFPGVKPPGAALLNAQGAVQVFVNANFDALSPHTSGTYQAKLRGTLEIATLQIDGDVDLTFRPGRPVRICAQARGLGGLCGKDLENAARRGTKKVVKVAKQGGRTAVKTGKTVTKATIAGALQTVRFFQKVPGALDSAFNDSVKALGKVASDGARNLRKPKDNKADARKMADRIGGRLRARAIAQAEEFFRVIRPKLQGLPPKQRARVVGESYHRLYQSVLASQRKLDNRGRNKVKGWSVNPKF